MPAKCGLTTSKPAKTFRWLYLPFTLVLGLGSMILATQRIAAFWNYQPALGKPLFTAFNLPWYAPWSAWSGQRKQRRGFHGPDQSGPVS
ncbi:MAG: hypothetical protein LBS65_08050 [Desulfovibrio sp.]|jgi:type IV secretion system protein VirD4|nr:hypothetical protein [Desulfovibrio sp.]